MSTPAQIFKMWTRVNGKFGLVPEDPKPKAKAKEKKFAAKAKQAEKEDARVKKCLTALRTLGRGDLTKPAPAKKFIHSRDKAAKSMKKYCKLLKGNELKESVKDLIKYRKAVKQLVVTVEALGVRSYPDEPEGTEPDLNALEKVDTTALDKAMEDPNFGEYSDAELDADDTDAEQGEAESEESKEADDKEESGEPEVSEADAEEKQGGTETTPPKAPPKPPDIQGLQFKQQLQKLMPQYQNALKAGAANRGALEMAMKMATAAAASKDFEKGLEQLAKLDQELKKATPPKFEPAAEWKARIGELTPAIKEALAAKGPNAGEIGKLFAQATALSKPGGDMVQALAKLDECQALIKASTAQVEPKGDPGEVFRAKVQAFRPAFDKALALSRANNPDLAEELDGFFAQMYDEARAKDFTTALQTLEILTKLVKTALVPPPPPNPAELKARLKDLLQRQRALFEKDPTQKSKLLSFSQQATALAPTGKPGAAEALDRLETAIVACEAAIKAANSGQEDNESQNEENANDSDANTETKDENAEEEERVEDSGEEEDAKAETDDEDDTPTTSMAMWNKAKDQADAEIDRLCGFLRKSREKPLLEAADKLSAAMGLFKVDLTTALMNLDNAGTEQKKQLFPAVNTVLSKYKDALIADKLLSSAEENPFVTVNAKKLLLGAIAKIQSTLEKQLSA